MKDKDAKLLEEAYDAVAAAKRAAHREKRLQKAYDSLPEDEKVSDDWWKEDPGTPGIYEIYQYTDPYRGFGHGKTIAYIKHAENKEDARLQYAEFRGSPWKHDPDGISYGIQQIEQIPEPPKFPPII